ncbi:hypothetical protein JTB14_010368, partial [Gonioctena quinquepunctata]
LGSAVSPPDKKLSINPNDIADCLQDISRSSALDKAFAIEINKPVTANLHLSLTVAMVDHFQHERTEHSPGKNEATESSRS